MKKHPCRRNCHPGLPAGEKVTLNLPLFFFFFLLELYLKFQVWMNLWDTEITNLNMDSILGSCLRWRFPNSLLHITTLSDGGSFSASASLSRCLELCLLNKLLFDIWIYLEPALACLFLSTEELEYKTQAYNLKDFFHLFLPVTYFQQICIFMVIILFHFLLIHQPLQFIYKTTTRINFPKPMLISIEHFFMMPLIYLPALSCLFCKHTNSHSCL